LLSWDNKSFPAMPRPSTEFKVTPELIRDAKRNNPPGVRVLELAAKKTEFYRDMSLIAGYLCQCPNTESLRSLVTLVTPLFEEYVSLRKNGWTSASIPNPVDAGNPICSSIFQFLHRLRSNHSAAELMNDPCTEPDPEKMTAIFGAVDLKQKASMTGFVVIVNILVKVIRRAPEYFSEPYVFDTEKGILLPNIEDIHRAYCLFRIWSRMNEGSRKPKSKTAKPQNNPATPVHYIPEAEMDDDGGDDNTQLTLDTILQFEAPSAPPSEVEEPVDVLDIVDMLHASVEAPTESEVSDLKKLINSSLPLTDQEMASLSYYASRNLNIRYDKWAEIGTEHDTEITVNEELRNVIRKVHQAATRYEKYSEARKAEGLEEPDADKDDQDTEETLDHASMKTHSTQLAASFLQVDAERPALFPEVPRSLVLLPHQLNGVSTMLEREREASNAVSQDIPTLQAGILADDMGLGKTLEMLSLVHLAHKQGLQVSGPRKAPPGPTLVCIPPAVALHWYTDYNRYFSNHLKMYFVGSSFRRGGDPVFKSHCIDREIFEMAIRDPANSPLFKDPDDIGRTLFMVSHFTINKFSVDKEIGDSTLSQDNEEHDQPAVSDLQSDRKVVRTPKKARATESSTQEAEDATLVAVEQEFDTYLVNYTSRFPRKVYRVIVDEGHVVRHPGSGISRAIKLLQPSFLWLMTATPLLNKTRDFYGYSQLLYNNDWSLDLSRDFTKLSTLEKYEKAQSEHEVLELFNPLYIRRLATKGHLDAAVAAITIPLLMRKCTIRRTQFTEINGRQIGEDIPQKHINSVIVTLGRAEQLQYCEVHRKCTKDQIHNVAQTGDSIEGVMDSRRVKNLMCASVCPRFDLLHRRAGQSRTKAGKLRGLATSEGAGLPFFLKHTHEASDYQYKVPSSRLDRAIELLNISPTLRYLCTVLYKVVVTQKKRLTIFAETPAVAWLLLMFCQNFGVQTAWLRSGMTQGERDYIVSDFNNIDGTLQVLISTHKIAGFGINLQLSGCHHMLIVEIPIHLNGLLQTQARLVRLGQENEVYIWILFTDHTFHRWCSANLAKKAISDLSAQLAGKLTSSEKADTETIDDHAEEALNVIMNWKENRSGWGDLHQLNLGDSLLSKAQQQTFSSIGGVPSDTKAVKEKAKKPMPKKLSTSAQAASGDVVPGQHVEPKVVGSKVVRGQQPQSGKPKTRKRKRDVDPTEQQPESSTSAASTPSHAITKEVVPGLQPETSRSKTRKRKRDVAPEEEQRESSTSTVGRATRSRSKAK
jgi:hypothetical protein